MAIYEFFQRNLKTEGWEHFDAKLAWRNQGYINTRRALTGPQEKN